MRYGAIQIVIAPDVSLEMYDMGKGRSVPCLAWWIDDKVYVHPDRWELFKKHVARIGSTIEE